MPPVTTTTLTINKTPPKGMNHVPRGNPVFVPDGGKIKICNLRPRRVRVRVVFDGNVTFNEFVGPEDCITLTMGSPQVPNGDYEVIDPPALLKLVGRRGGVFKIQRPKRHK